MKEYGIYTTNSKGESVLSRIDEAFTGSEYKVRSGTAVIERDAFLSVPSLSTLLIPSSLRQIPDGTLSNSGGWASDEPGITAVEIDPENPVFALIGCFFCRRKEGGTMHLIRALNVPEHTVIPACITSVGEKAFAGRIVKSVTFEDSGMTVYFPAGHRYYLDVRLDDFGKNGKFFDFDSYDRSLIFDHFNPERIQMICTRLSDPRRMEEETKDRIFSNTLSHMDDVMEAVIKDGDCAALELLSKNGFFTKDNIGLLTDQVGSSMRKDLMFWMMDHKNSRFGTEEEDLFI